MDKPNEAIKCRFCGNEIQPLDKHAHVIYPDKDTAERALMRVVCILERYYNILPERVK